MKKFLCLALLLLFTSATALSKSNDSAPTKELCEKQSGLWREFGNDCADNCKPKFNKLSICTQLVTFACDCGENKCFEGGMCVSNLVYQKFFEEKQAKEQKILEKQKVKRVKEFKEKKEELVRKIMENKSQAQNQEQGRNIFDSKDATKSPTGVNNYSDLSKKQEEESKKKEGNKLAQNKQNQRVQNQQAQSPQDAGPLQNNSAVDNSKMLPSIEVNNPNPSVPSLFLKQEQQANKNADAADNKVASSTNSVASGSVGNIKGSKVGQQTGQQNNANPIAPTTNDKKPSRVEDNIPPLFPSAGVNGLPMNLPQVPLPTN